MCKTVVITTTQPMFLTDQLRHLKVQLGIGAPVPYSFNFILTFSLEYVTNFLFHGIIVRIAEWSKALRSGRGPVLFELTPVSSNHTSD